MYTSKIYVRHLKITRQLKDTNPNPNPKTEFFI